MKHSIKTQLISVFIGILFLTLMISWGLNNFCLYDFYLREKQASYVEYYDSLNQILSADEKDTDRLIAVISKMRYADNISVILTMDMQTTLYVENMISKTEAEEMYIRLKDDFAPVSSETTADTRSYNNFIKVLEQNDQYTIQQKTYTASSTSYLECFGKFDGGMMFLMSIPISWVHDSVTISNEFLLFSFLAVAVLAVILISAVTRSITKPLLQLADISRGMAELDFSRKYDGSQHNEIDILGQSMNQMADQLKETISELQSANEQLRKDIDEKIQIDEVRKEFLSNVSHELKTPIALIQGYAEGLQEVVNDDPESRNYYCDVIIDEADKMNSMVKKLLTLNHLEFGQDAIAMETFDIAEMLDTVIQNNSLIAEKKEAHFEKKYHPGCMVTADEFKIEEVVTNYLSNALNHADGEKKISVMVEEEEKTYRITVENTGKPIPEDSLDKVWIKFYKVDKARTREYGGSGIGLSIVKAIMDAHHQAFGVYNTPTGVAFWFCLEKGSEERPEQDE